MEKLPACLGEAIGSIDAAITVCDADLRLLYMNEKAAITFGGRGPGPLVGSSLVDCHKPQSVEKMKAILASGQPNVYTISKNGVRKLIWQGPWEKDGEIGGLVEISIPLPDSMPHYDRG
ncbi:MAG: PAS domain-containing protein [Candidatus Hydrogenedentales bacterium]